jgi:hypothetical protein
VKVADGCPRVSRYQNEAVKYANRIEVESRDSPGIADANMMTG